MRGAPWPPAIRRGGEWTAHAHDTRNVALATACGHRPTGARHPRRRSVHSPPCRGAPQTIGPAPRQPRPPPAHCRVCTTNPTRLHRPDSPDGRASRERGRYARLQRGHCQRRPWPSAPRRRQPQQKHGDYRATPPPQPTIMTHFIQRPRPLRGPGRAVGARQASRSRPQTALKGSDTGCERCGATRRTSREMSLLVTPSYDHLPKSFTSFAKPAMVAATRVTVPQECGWRRPGQNEESDFLPCCTACAVVFLITPESKCMYTETT